MGVGIYGVCACVCACSAISPSLPSHSGLHQQRWIPFPLSQPIYSSGQMFTDPSVVGYHSHVIGQCLGVRVFVHVCA